ncbi:MAG TPA: hypothetical protein VGO62_13370, partial [Myxococcota bacterium]
MAGKWKIEELRVGAVYEAMFYANPVEGSGFRFRATHLDGRRAPKVILCNDEKITPGVPWRVKITSIT